MSEKLIKYFELKEKEKKEKRDKFLIREGLYEKEYSDEYVNGEWDPEKNQRYIKKAIEVTDEEYEKILEYAKDNEIVDNSGVEMLMRVSAIVIYVSGSVAALFMIAENAIAGLFSTILSAFINGTMFLSFAEIIKLLKQI